MPITTAPKNHKTEHENQEEISFFNDARAFLQLAGDSFIAGTQYEGFQSAGMVYYVYNLLEEITKSDEDWCRDFKDNSQKLISCLDNEIIRVMSFQKHAMGLLIRKVDDYEKDKKVEVVISNRGDGSGYHNINTRNAELPRSSFKHQQNPFFKIEVQGDYDSIKSDVDQCLHDKEDKWLNNKIVDLYQHIVTTLMKYTDFKVVNVVKFEDMKMQASGTCTAKSLLALFMYVLDNIDEFKKLKIILKIMALEKLNLGEIKDDNVLIHLQDITLGLLNTIQTKRIFYSESAKILQTRLTEFYSKISKDKLTYTGLTYENNLIKSSEFGFTDIYNKLKDKRNTIIKRTAPNLVSNNEITDETCINNLEDISSYIKEAWYSHSGNHYVKGTSTDIMSINIIEEYLVKNIIFLLDRESKRICGDLDYDEMKNHASIISELIEAINQLTSLNKSKIHIIWHNDSQGWSHKLVTIVNSLIVLNGYYNAFSIRIKNQGLKLLRIYNKSLELIISVKWTLSAMSKQVIIHELERKMKHFQSIISDKTSGLTDKELLTDEMKEKLFSISFEVPNKLSPIKCTKNVAFETLERIYLLHYELRGLILTNGYSNNSGFTAKSFSYYIDTQKYYLAFDDKDPNYPYTSDCLSFYSSLDAARIAINTTLYGENNSTLSPIYYIQEYGGGELLKYTESYHDDNADILFSSEDASTLSIDFIKAQNGDIEGKKRGEFNTTSNDRIPERLLTTVRSMSADALTNFIRLSKHLIFGTIKNSLELNSDSLAIENYLLTIIANHEGILGSVFADNCCEVISELYNSPEFAEQAPFYLYALSLHYDHLRSDNRDATNIYLDQKVLQQLDRYIKIENARVNYAIVHLLQSYLMLKAPYSLYDVDIEVYTLYCYLYVQANTFDLDEVGIDVCDLVNARHEQLKNTLGYLTDMSIRMFEENSVEQIKYKKLNKLFKGNRNIVKIQYLPEKEHGIEVVFNDSTHTLLDVFGKGPWSSFNLREFLSTYLFKNHSLVKALINNGYHIANENNKWIFKSDKCLHYFILHDDEKIEYIHDKIKNIYIKGMYDTIETTSGIFLDKTSNFLIGEKDSNSKEIILIKYRTEKVVIVSANSMVVHEKEQVINIDNILTARMEYDSNNILDKDDLGGSIRAFIYKENSTYQLCIPKFGLNMKRIINQSEQDNNLNKDIVNFGLEGFDNYKPVYISSELIILADSKKQDDFLYIMEDCLSANKDTASHVIFKHKDGSLDSLEKPDHLLMYMYISHKINKPVELRVLKKHLQANMQFSEVYQEKYIYNYFTSLCKESFNIKELPAALYLLDHISNYVILDDIDKFNSLDNGILTSSCYEQYIDGFSKIHDEKLAPETLINLILKTYSTYRKNRKNAIFNVQKINRMFRNIETAFLRACFHENPKQLIDIKETKINIESSNLREPYILGSDNSWKQKTDKANSIHNIIESIYSTLNINDKNIKWQSMQPLPRKTTGRGYQEQIEESKKLMQERKNQEIADEESIKENLPENCIELISEHINTLEVVCNEITNEIRGEFKYQSLEAYLDKKNNDLLSQLFADTMRPDDYVLRSRSVQSDSWQTIKPCLLYLFTCKTEIQHWSRILKYIETEDSLKAYAAITRKRAYKLFDKDTIPFILLEYHKNIRLSAIQINMAETLIKDPEALVPAPIGSGKTTVLVAVIQILAIKKKKPCLILSESLLNTQGAQIVQDCEKLFRIGRPLLCVESSPDKIKYFRDVIDIAPIVITTRECIQTLVNKRLLNSLEDRDSISAFINRRYIIDEVDQNLAPSLTVINGLGENNTIPDQYTSFYISTISRLFFRNIFVTKQSNKDQKFPGSKNDYELNYKEKILKKLVKNTTDDIERDFFINKLMPAIAEHKYNYTWCIGKKSGLAEPLNSGVQTDLQFKDIHVKVTLTIFGYFLEKSDELIKESYAELVSDYKLHHQANTTGYSHLIDCLGKQNLASALDLKLLTKDYSKNEMEHEKNIRQLIEYLNIDSEENYKMKIKLVAHCLKRKISSISYDKKCIEQYGADFVYGEVSGCTGTVFGAEHLTEKERPIQTITMDGIILNQLDKKNIEISVYNSDKIESLINDKTQMIIDPTQLELTSDGKFVSDIAKQMYSKNNNLKWVLFFDSETNLKGWNILEGKFVALNHTGEDYLKQTLNCQSNQWSVILDAAHSRGCDIVIADDAHAVLLLSSQISYSDLLQAVGRLRKFDTQSISIYTTQSMYKELKAIKKGEDNEKSSITPKDLVNWALKKEQAQTSNLKNLVNKQRISAEDRSKKGCMPNSIYHFKTEYSPESLLIQPGSIKMHQKQVSKVQVKSNGTNFACPQYLNYKENDIKPEYPKAGCNMIAFSQDLKNRNDKYPIAMTRMPITAVLLKDKLVVALSDRDTKHIKEKVFYLITDIIDKKGKYIELAAEQKKLLNTALPWLCIMSGVFDIPEKILRMMPSLDYDMDKEVVGKYANYFQQDHCGYKKNIINYLTSCNSLNDNTQVIIARLARTFLGKRIPAGQNESNELITKRIETEFKVRAQNKNKLQKAVCKDYSDTYAYVQSGNNLFLEALRSHAAKVLGIACRKKCKQREEYNKWCADEYGNKVLSHYNENNTQQKFTSKTSSGIVVYDLKNKIKKSYMQADLYVLTALNDVYKRDKSYLNNSFKPEDIEQYIAKLKETLGNCVNKIKSVYKAYKERIRYMKLEKSITTIQKLFKYKKAQAQSKASLESNMPKKMNKIRSISTEAACKNSNAQAENRYTNMMHSLIKKTVNVGVGYLRVVALKLQKVILFLKQLPIIIYNCIKNLSYIFGFLYLFLTKYLLNSRLKNIPLAQHKTKFNKKSYKNINKKDTIENNYKKNFVRKLFAYK